jgi:2,5-diketo-D-gluconate reductase A
MIDTAADYGTQPGIGEAIRRAGLRRDDFYLVGKVEETDDAYEATRRNLDELGLEHADLMLIHRPPENGAGARLWEGLLRAKEEGLTRDVGVSNYTTELIDALIEATGEVPVVNQIEWSPFGHGGAMRRYADKHQIVIQAYSPLTHGTRLDHPALKKIADRYGRSPAQLMIRWNLQRGTVPLPKANDRQHLKENIEVFDFEISEADLARLDRFNERYSALGSLPYH